jgi:pilus assembly protein CpaC
MHVKPEVSTIDLANSVVFSGFTIPALATRRMETDIELGEGQSFVIAGLIDDRITENLSKVPGLSQIPILGALFKSRSETKSKTELLVMVTPETVHPLLPEDNPLPRMPKEFLPGIFPPRSGDSRKTQPDAAVRPGTADAGPITEPHTHFMAAPAAAGITKTEPAGLAEQPSAPTAPKTDGAPDRVDPDKHEAEKGSR